MPAPDEPAIATALDLECIPARADFHEILAATDLAILAGGLTLYETAFLGVPAVALPHRSGIPGHEMHQLDTARKLEAAGCCVTPGMAEDVTADELADVLQPLIADAAARARLSGAGTQLIDGQGLQRTVGLILDALDSRA